MKRYLTLQRESSNSHIWLLTPCLALIPQALAKEKGLKEDVEAKEAELKEINDTLQENVMKEWQRRDEAQQEAAPPLQKAEQLSPSKVVKPEPEAAPLPIPEEATFVAPSAENVYEEEVDASSDSLDRLLNAP